MSRDEALEKLARILEQHYPHPVFGCECAGDYPEGHPLHGEGRIMPIAEDWTDHVAKIAFDAAKGF